MYDFAPVKINSASNIPPCKTDEPSIRVTSPQPTSMALPAVFRQYVEQHRSYAEHTRHAQEQERELWHLERVQLLERIKELEQAVMLLGGNVDDSLRSGESHDAPAGADPLHQLHSVNIKSNGSQYWKGAGGIGATQPTRAFSEPSNTSYPSIVRPHHLPSIHETTNPRKKSVGFDMTHTGSIEKDFHVHPIPTIPMNVDGNGFDSITFKPSVLSSIGASHRSSGTQSPSPLHTPQNPPGQREPKPQLLDLPNSGLTSSDLLVKDAGHTPLARLTESFSASSQDTPVKDDENHIRPTEKAVRPPTERSDSYFPAAENPTEQYATNDDPALKEPLSLSSKQSATENDDFLSAVDSKLRKAQTDVAEENSEALNASPAVDGGANKSTHNGEGDSLESEDPEPTLRIRSSTNFGTAFGAAAPGKDI